MSQSCLFAEFGLSEMNEDLNGRLLQIKRKLAVAERNFVVESCLQHISISRRWDKAQTSGDFDFRLFHRGVKRRKRNYAH